MSEDDDAQWSLSLCQSLAELIKATESPDQKSILYKLWFDLMDWMLMRHTPSFLVGNHSWRKYEIFIEVMVKLRDPELSSALWDWVVGLARDCGQDNWRRSDIRCVLFDLILEGPYKWSDRDDMLRTLRLFALLNDKSLRWAVLDGYEPFLEIDDAKARFASDMEKFAEWCRENAVAIPFTIDQEVLSAFDESR